MYQVEDQLTSLYSVNPQDAQVLSTQLLLSL